MIIPYPSKAFRFWQNLKAWQLYFLAFLSGAALTFTLAPFCVLPLGFLSFTLFALLLRKITLLFSFSAYQKLKASFFLGWSFAFGYFTFGLWWLGSALFINPSRDLWALPLALLALPAFLSLYWGASTLFTALFTRYSIIIQFFFLAASFALMEWLRSFLFTGFAWNSLGYCLMPSVFFMQPAALFGLYGMNFFAVLFFSAPSLFFCSSGWQQKALLAAVGSLCLIFLLFSGWRLHHAPAIAEEIAEPYLLIRLVQPDTAQQEKTDNLQRFNTLQKLLALSTKSTNDRQHPYPDVIIWPETALPYVPEFMPQVLDYIRLKLHNKQILLTGAVHAKAEKNPRAKQGSPQLRFFNSLLAIDARHPLLAVSNKQHLVPFGEYLPFAPLWEKLHLHAIAQAIGQYSAGSERRSVVLGNGLIYLPLICYEATFPHELCYNGMRANIIINVTNDAWYPHTIEAYQHFQQAQLRAVEQNLPLIRVANRGICALIDAYGRILYAVGPGKTVIKDCKLSKNMFLNRGTFGT